MILRQQDGWWKKFLKMQNNKILIINNGLAGGGIERASASLANYFVTLGYNINILATYRSEHFYSLNSQISFTEPLFSRDDTYRSLYVFKMMKYVRQAVIRIKPDIILAYGEWTNPYIILATLGLNIPIYVSDRMNPLAKLPLFSDFLRRLLYRHAAGIIAQTNFAKKILFQKTKASNIKVIPNPVNVVNRVECSLKNQIVTVGRLTIEKGHEILIKAFAQVEDKTWNLCIVGDGDERDKLELLAGSLGVSERVLFTGHLKDFSLQLSESQIFVLPSLKEGFPNALIEAMSLPLACISTDFLKGDNEIIQHGMNGLVVPVENVNELANAMNNLILNNELRIKLAQNAYKIREELAFEKISHQYLNFITSND